MFCRCESFGLDSTASDGEVLRCVRCDGAIPCEFDFALPEHPASQWYLDYDVLCAEHLRETQAKQIENLRAASD